jgi:hypothetical protein
MDDMRQQTRYPLAFQRECSLCVITFKDLSWKDHAAQLKDISKGGVGIESEDRIDRGFVWFNGRVGGYRGGVLLWSRQTGFTYRAGIQLVKLTRDQEQFVQEQVSLVRAHEPLRNPEAIIATIMDSMTRNRNGRN